MLKHVLTIDCSGVQEYLPCSLSLLTGVEHDGGSQCSSSTHCISWSLHCLMVPISVDVPEQHVEKNDQNEYQTQNRVFYS